jgi:hypothetical protein
MNKFKIEYQQILINNIFAIGFRCNSDEFLKDFLKIRKYSSPFSYMIIDIKTSLDFIKNKFKNYTNRDYIDPGTNSLKFNKNDWCCCNIHKYSKITSDNMDILDMDTVCIWNHHDLYDENIINSFNRRSVHLLECVNKKPTTTLLFYIEKIQKYKEKDYYFDINLLNNFKCNFLILIPLLNFNSDPILFYDDLKIRIIYFNSNLELWGTDIKSHIEEWNKLQTLIFSLYNFNIENRNDN